MRPLSLIGLLISMLIAAGSAVAGPSEIPAARVAGLFPQLADRPQGLGAICANRAAWGTLAMARRTEEVRRTADKLLNQQFPKWVFAPIEY